MSLDLVALKAAILADPTLEPLYTIGNMDGLAQALNVTASPAYIVWRDDYTPAQIAEAISVGITQLDGLTASKRDSLLWWANLSHDARKTTTQAAINDLCGSQNTLKAALNDGAKRSATVLEKIFATGTGSAASPGVTTWTGTVGWTELIGM